jgi:hypothetical protein
VVEGHLKAAQAGSVVGEEAFHRLARGGPGLFRIEYRDSPLAANLTKPNTYLLIEAMRRVDEAAAAAPPAAEASPGPTTLDIPLITPVEASRVHLAVPVPELEAATRQASPRPDRSDTLREARASDSAFLSDFPSDAPPRRSSSSWALRADLTYDLTLESDEGGDDRWVPPESTPVGAQLDAAIRRLTGEAQDPSLEAKLDAARSTAYSKVDSKVIARVPLLRVSTVGPEPTSDLGDPQE